MKKIVVSLVVILTFNISHAARRDFVKVVSNAVFKHGRLTMVNTIDMGYFKPTVEMEITSVNIAINRVAESINNGIYLNELKKQTELNIPSTCRYSIMGLTSLKQEENEPDEITGLNLYFFELCEGHSIQRLISKSFSHTSIIHDDNTLDDISEEFIELLEERYDYKGVQR